MRTPDYTKKAVDRYRKKHDFIQVRLPAGTRARMDDLGLTASAFIDVIMRELERLEQENAEKP